MIGHLPFTNRVHLTEVSVVCHKKGILKYDLNISVTAIELTAKCFSAYSCFVHGRVLISQRILCRVQDEQGRRGALPHSVAATHRGPSHETSAVGARSGPVHQLDLSSHWKWATVAAAGRAQC